MKSQLLHVRLVELDENSLGEGESGAERASGKRATYRLAESFL